MFQKTIRRGNSNGYLSYQQITLSSIGVQKSYARVLIFFSDSHTQNNLNPRIFVCVSFVHIHAHSKGKLDPWALKYIFVGYSLTQKGYKCYHLPFKRYFVSDVMIFVEKEDCFTGPYLQSETSFMKDKNKDFFFFLIYLPLLNLLHPTLLFVPCIAPLQLLFLLSNYPLLIPCLWLRKNQLTIQLDHYRYAQGRKHPSLNLCKSKSWSQPLEMSNFST